MVYIIIAILVILISSVFIYFKPKETKTKNIFNAEYYRGLNYLLNNEEDKAFKIFTALMDVDSSTIETHLALGGLYRKRGEFDKAILIHQNLLSRPTLESELKNQSLYELAKDFYSAGLYDRAEKIFKNLSEIKVYRQSSLEYLLKIFEQTKDWNKAIDFIKTIDSKNINNIKMENLLAQYYCEVSYNYMKESQFEKAIAISKKALKINNECIRANLQLANCYAKSDINFSIQYYNAVINQNHVFAAYVVDKILDLGKNINNSVALSSSMISLSTNSKLSFIPNIYLFLHYKKDNMGAKNYIDSFDLNNSKNSFLISHTLATILPQDEKSHVINNISNSYKKIFTNSLHFICNNCGYKSHILNWFCPSCNSWECIVPKSTIDIIEDGKINESN